MPSSRSTRRFAPLLFAAGIAVAAWRMPMFPTPRFVVPPVMPASQRAPLTSFFVSRMLPQDAPSAHACSLAIAPDGALLAAWFGGESEGARDVAIHMVRVPVTGLGPAPTLDAACDGTSSEPLSEPWVSLDRERLQALTSRVIRKIGNPVLWFDGAGALHMHVVSVSYGGWSGSALNQLVSDDEGRSWREARRLIVSPLLNLSTLVRTQPQVLEDGSIGLPTYHEFVQKWGAWLRVTTEGQVLDAAPMQRLDGDWLQPAVAAISPVDAVAALRCAGRSRRVGWSATRDGGRSWSLPPDRSTLDIANPDSSVAMIRLSDGTLLMACNPAESGRNRLQLFRSRDEGESWQPSRRIEASDAEGDEFSYPALVQDRHARIHLGYTWKRQGIRLCSFSPEWLDAEHEDRPAVEGDPSASVAPNTASARARPDAAPEPRP